MSLLILVSNDFSWQFTGTDEEGAKSIPYQLQRLFLQLQVQVPVLVLQSSSVICLFPCNVQIWFDAKYDQSKGKLSCIVHICSVII